MTSSVLAAVVASSMSAGIVAAQAPSTPLSLPAASQLKQQYISDMDTVHAKIAALAGAIPADKYTWRPATGVRSISEVLMHLAGEWYFYCPRSIGQQQPPDFGDPEAKLAAFEKVSAKDRVMSEMQKSWNYCKAKLEAADAAGLTGNYKPWNQPLGQAAFSMTGDQHEHLGQLIAYARSVGVKPPWSK